MKHWNLKALDLKPRLPEILSTSDEGRVIALDLAAGEDLAEHEVHERAWVVVVSGAVEIGTRSGATVAGSSGLMVEFGPGERHYVKATQESRLLLILAPWPGDGHPGAMTMRDKLYARRRAAKSAEEPGTEPRPD